MRRTLRERESGPDGRVPDTASDILKTYGIAIVSCVAGDEKQLMELPESLSFQRVTRSTGGRMSKRNGGSANGDSPAKSAELPPSRKPPKKMRVVKSSEVTGTISREAARAAVKAVMRERASAR